jgi:beta-phosphoglucomutase-like phosphatase (HAD superfamily)
VFVAAAAALGVEPSACLCFEDAPSGVEVRALVARCWLWRPPSVWRLLRRRRRAHITVTAATHACTQRTLQGAVAAGMKVVVVPSLVGSKEDYSILSKQQQQDSLAAGGVCARVLPPRCTRLRVCLAGLQVAACCS